MCTPCTTPMRFTPIVHSQTASGASTMPPPPTPALLHTTWTAPNAASARSRTASTSAATATSVGTPDHLGAAGLELGHRGRQRSRLHVGQHQAHAVGREAPGQRPADAAGPAGDHGHPVLQLPHRAPLRLVLRAVLPAADCPHPASSSPR